LTGGQAADEVAASRIALTDDGRPLTSRDVKASYDKIIFPPAGVVSARKGAYQAVEAVEAPDPLTVRFRLQWPEASFPVNLSSPFNWIGAGPSSRPTS
jgi:peptide/nickel transport system substrate-binding protein